MGKTVTTKQMAAVFAVTILLMLGDNFNFIATKQYLKNLQIASCLCAILIFAVLLRQSYKNKLLTLGRFGDSFILAILGSFIFYFLCLGALPAVWTMQSGSPFEIKVGGVLKKQPRQIGCGHAIKINIIDDAFVTSNQCIDKQFFEYATDTNKSSFLLNGRISTIGFKTNTLVAE